MPTYTTITENRDGTYTLTVHSADALRRIRTMCDIIREDFGVVVDADVLATAAYAEDLYRVIGDALTLADSAGETCPNCEPHHAPCADCAALAH